MKEFTLEKNHFNARNEENSGNGESNFDSKIEMSNSNLISNENIESKMDLVDFNSRSQENLGDTESIIDSKIQLNNSNPNNAENFATIESKMDLTSFKPKFQENLYDNESNKNLNHSNSIKNEIQQIHKENTKPFSCNICKLQFNEKSSMKRHIAGVHEGKKPFHCQICNKNFGSKSDLYRHLKTRAHNDQKERERRKHPNKGFVFINQEISAFFHPSNFDKVTLSCSCSKMALFKRA